MSTVQAGVVSHILIILIPHDYFIFFPELFLLLFLCDAGIDGCSRVAASSKHPINSLTVVILYYGISL